MKKDIRQTEFSLYSQDKGGGYGELEIYTIQDIINGNYKEEEEIPLLNSLAFQEPGSEIFDIIFKQHPELMDEINFDLTDEMGDTLINVVCETNYDVAAALIDYGVDLNTGESSPIVTAIYYSDSEKSKLLIKKLLENGADPLYLDKNTNLSPIFDCLSKRPDFMEDYLDYVDVNSKKFNKELSKIKSMFPENLVFFIDLVEKKRTKEEKNKISNNIKNEKVIKKQKPL